MNHNNLSIKYGFNNSPRRACILGTVLTVLLAPFPTLPRDVHAGGTGSSGAIHGVSSDSVRSSQPSESDGAIHYTYEIVRTYPHDPTAFTQGLAFDDGILYEGTGRYGQSTLRKVNLSTGRILKILRLPAEMFGEGVTVYGKKVIQLTFRSRIGFVYDKGTLNLLRHFSYAKEGWGITHDEKHLIMSDGTSTLYYLNPDTFEVVRRVEVRDRGTPVTRLNELEYIHGEIFANIWRTDYLVRICPRTGRVLGWVDLKGLLGVEGVRGSVDVLNGIAYDTKRERLLVTGKLWPKIFEIKLFRVNR